MLPQGFLGHDRHEAFAFGQAQDVPQAVVELRAIDAVAVRAFRQAGAVDVTDVDASTRSASDPCRTTASRRSVP